MTFTVVDFNDLKHLLAQHPDWRVELRHLLLTDDIEALPGIVRELADAQRRTEARVEELAEAQRRTEVRIAELAEAQRRTEARVEELVEAQRWTEARIAELADALRRTDERIGRLEHRVDRIDIRLARVDGRTLEAEYREKATSYFGRWIRRGEVMRANDVWGLLEDRLGGEALQDVLRADLLVRGRLTRSPDRPEVWLAVEVSCVIDRDDVVRADRRAGLLRRAGLVAIPVVAGADASDDAEAEARAHKVAILKDGSDLLWDEAIAAWA